MSANLTAPLSTTNWEDSDLFVMARVLAISGSVITQATISSATVKVYDTDSGNALTYSATLTVSSVVYDTLQTSDSRWTVDATGYNFAYSVPAAAFAHGGRTYQVEIRLVPTSGGDIHVVVRSLTRNLIGS